MKITALLVIGLLIGYAGTVTHAATPEPSAQETGKPKPRKSKRLPPPCADEPTDRYKAGKKKPG